MSQTYRQLQVWRRSKPSAVAVHRLTVKPPFATGEMAGLLQECDEISAMLQALINHRRTS